MKPPSPMFWSILAGVIIGLGISHSLRERAAYARLRAPMLLDASVPAAQTRGDDPDVSVSNPPSERGSGVAYRSRAMAANAHGVYVLQGIRLQLLDPATLKPRKMVDLPPASLR